MNSHGPRNLLCRRKAALHELGQPAQRKSECVCTLGQGCAHTSTLHRDVQLPSIFTANTTGIPHPAGMTCLGFQRHPLLKWKNTSRILKHTSQNKGSKFGAEVLHTMKPRAAMSSSVYKRDGNKHQLPKTHNLM